MARNLKIALFTSANQGGIIQLNVELWNRLTKYGFDVDCFMPDNVTLDNGVIDKKNVKIFRRDLLHNRVVGAIEEMLSGGKDVKSIIKNIIGNKYDIFWTTDTSAFSLKIIFDLSKIKKRPFTIISVHDAEAHPTFNKSLKAKYLYWTGRYYYNAGIKSADMHLFFSNLTRDKFSKIYPALKTMNVVVPLGAHVPNVVECKPSEIEGEKFNYYLFFGRLDKYKGIENILKAFTSSNDLNERFIVAGNGYLSEEEKRLIQSDERIILIKRFISDGEMIWLINNAEAVTLPYLEASQSGVIPIAYSYGTPVITSNVKGLTQFVINNKTGIVCSSLQDYVVALHQISDKSLRNYLSLNDLEYYNENLDWDNNLKSLTKKLEKVLEAGDN